MATAVAPVIPRHPSTFDKVHKVQVASASQSVSASRPPTAPVKPSPDLYYGHEPTAKLCCRFVTHLFACPEYPPQGGAQPGNSPALAQFIAYALHRTRLHESVTFAALYLLQRLKQRFPAARGSSGHRLFLSAFMIASKVICDDTYSNKSWCIVGQGMFALREVNQMEREMCAYLDWELNVDPAALREFEHLLRTNFSGPGPYTVTLPVPPSKGSYVQSEPATITVETPPQTSPPRPRTSAPRQRSHDELAAAAAAAAARRYPSPESPDSPDTPESSHSMSTSLASTPSPRTPHSIEHAHATIVAQESPAGPTAHMHSTAALKAQHMVRALQAEPGAPVHFGVPAASASAPSAEPLKGKPAPTRTFSMPRTRGGSEPFAFAVPVAW